MAGDFELVICVGAQKAGTSSLHSVLGSLPEFSTSRQGKEIDFISRYYDFGFGWYLDHFDRGRRYGLDVSPNYLMTADLAGRLDALPVPYRCVLMARHPVDRALSQHRHSLLRFPRTTPTDFAEALALNPTYVTNGEYGRALAALAPVVPPDRLHVVWFEDLVSSPGGVVDGLLAELGVASRPSEALLAQRVNESAAVRSGGVHRATRAVGACLRRLGGERAVARVRQLRVTSTVRSLNRATPPEPAAAGGGDGAAVLAGRFDDDLRLAAEVTGLPFTRYLGGGAA